MTDAEKLAIAIAALTEIACFYDSSADKRYRETGEAWAFDSPSDVLLARKTLEKIGVAEPTRG